MKVLDGLKLKVSGMETDMRIYCQIYTSMNSREGIYQFYLFATRLYPGVSIII